MLAKTFGVVLSRIKFGETDVISKVYTKHFGLKSFLAKGVRKKKSRLNFSLFNPFNIVEIDFSDKQGRELQIVKEIKLVDPSQLNNLEDPRRSAIAYFLAEVFSSTLQEDDFDEQTFNFLLDLIYQLGELNQNFGDFAPIYLWKFTKHLGILPAISSEGNYFNISNGEFQSKIFTEYPIEEKTSFEIKNIFSTSTEIKAKVSASNLLLEAVLNYYQYHISYFNKPKSLEVLKALFN